MKRICKGIAALILSIMILPLNSYAWNATGHRVIAMIAYERLKPAVRAKVDIMTADLGKEYPYIKHFDDIAPWPDMLRSQRIDTYTHWHYIDTEFSADKTPLKSLNDTDNVVWALKQMLPVIANNNANPYERARFLAFLVHMSGDIHQPLHTVSRVSSTHPSGDRGGNLFIIQYKGQGPHYNLHSLWDTGVGVVSSDSAEENIVSISHSITQHYPESTFGAAVHDVKPEDWAAEGYKLATTLVYATPENEMPNSHYIEEGKQVSEQRLALAGYRLAAQLNQLLEE